MIKYQLQIEASKKEIKFLDYVDILAFYVIMIGFLAQFDEIIWALEQPIGLLRTSMKHFGKPL